MCDHNAPRPPLNRVRRVTIAQVQHSSTLPIDAVLADIQQALRVSSRCLLVAQPGAGKTTRVPLALLGSTPPESGRWLLLEPRRVAARLAAGYMAEQLGEALGQTVGLRVRGETRVSTRTRLEVVTQGILTRMLQDDPLLEDIAGIIFDEFHERSLDADLGLALALDVQKQVRDDLRLLVMSATLDVDSLLRVLGDSTPVIDCPGRAWPVQTLYRTPPRREAGETHQANVVLEALSQHDGNILVFLPGQGEIRRLQSLLQDKLPIDVEVCPLHGQLSLPQQQAVLGATPQGRRRIILSTAIAESSITVPGVRTVIDAGLERVPVFQPRSGLTRLETRRVNRASADQRQGRAGREAAGTCYRLWSTDTALSPHREAEILQADLSGLVFDLVRWGMKDPVSECLSLSWVNVPPLPALRTGRALLQTLGLTDALGAVTALGKLSVRWPTHPRLAVLLETAIAHDCLPLACWLLAWLEESIASPELDLAVTLARRPAQNNRNLTSADSRWLRAATLWANRVECSLAVRSLEPLPILLARAYPDRIALSQSGISQQSHGANPNHDEVRYKLVSGGQALLPARHPLARFDWLIAVELDGDASGARVFHAAALPQKQLEEIFPETRRWRELVRWDEGAGRLIGEEVRGLGNLIVARRPMQSLPPEAIRAGLVAGIRQRGHLKWSDDDQQTLGRLRLLHKELGSPWPDVAEQTLLSTLGQWLAPRIDGITRLAQIDRLSLGRYLEESLDWSLQQQLANLAPTHIAVPSGSKIAVDYSQSEPILAVRLQEMFGQTDTPTIVGGRVTVLLHLLSPARRPVQVTRDLAGFWATSYFDVRRDLRGRYPRHPWPDNPLQAEATSRARRRPA